MNKRKVGFIGAGYMGFGMAKNLINNPNILTVKFEDLIKDPERTLLKVCDHIGLDFEIQLLNSC